MAVPSKFAREQYEALLAEESPKRQHSSNSKINFRRTIDHLRKVFTPSSTEESGLSSPPSEHEWFSQGRSKRLSKFEGGHRLSASRGTSSANISSALYGSDSGTSDGVNSGWTSTQSLLSGTNFLSQNGETDECEAVATPWDSALVLVTPAFSSAAATSSDAGGSCARFPSRQIRNASQGTIHHGHGAYTRFGSITKEHKVTIQRAPSVRSQSALSVCNSDLDEAESLAEAFPEISEVVFEG